MADIAVEGARALLPDVLAAAIADAKTPEQIDGAARVVREYAASELAKAASAELGRTVPSSQTLDEIVQKIASALDKEANASSNDNPSRGHSTTEPNR